jgi:hypothetical protein
MAQFGGDSIVVGGGFFGGDSIGGFFRGLGLDAANMELNRLLFSILVD